MNEDAPEQFAIFGIPLIQQKDAYHASPEEIEAIKKLDYPSKLERGVFISTSPTVLDGNKELKGITDAIWYAANYYKNTIMSIRNEIAMVHSWTGINCPGGYHNDHRHRGALFGAVYYAQVPENSGDLVVTQDVSSLEKSMNFEYDVVDHNLFNSRWRMVPSIQGSIVIFPSWLDHATQTNESNEDRIVVAANFQVTGVVGSEPLNKINISKV